MPIPSARTIATRLSLPVETARAVRRAMEQHERSGAPFASEALDTIAGLIGAHGAELIPPGHGARSTSIEYANTGETYAPTVLYLDGVTAGGRSTGRGRWAVGSWGDIVDRRRYRRTR